MNVEGSRPRTHTCIWLGLLTSTSYGDQCLHEVNRCLNTGIVEVSAVDEPDIFSIPLDACGRQNPGKAGADASSLTQSQISGNQRAGRSRTHGLNRLVRLVKPRLYAIYRSTFRLNGKRSDNDAPSLVDFRRIEQKRRFG